MNRLGFSAGVATTHSTGILSFEKPEIGEGWISVVVDAPASALDARPELAKGFVTEVRDNDTSGHAGRHAALGE